MSFFPKKKRKLLSYLNNFLEKRAGSLKQRYLDVHKKPGWKKEKGMLKEFLYYQKLEKI